MTSPLVGALLVALSACNTPSPATTASPARSCVAGAAERVPAESLSVAVTAPIAPSHAPRPANGAERFVFAQLYETLIDVDCDGRPLPGLARSWTTDATKTRVTLTLRENARFWNGDPVTARDVLAAWQATAGSPADSNHVAQRVADGTTIVDDRTLTVSLPNTDSLVLAEPALAVVRRLTGTRWPMGTGPYRATEPARDVAPGQLTLLPTDRAAPRIVIRSGPDARDAIDAGVDLLLTADPVALSYAATRPEYAVAALPWNRTYALAVPGRLASAVAEPLAGDAAAFRVSLARDAVRIPAQAADTPAWWSSVHGCESGQPPSSAPPAGRQTSSIVYRADDPVARGLAERLVAVGRRATAVALTPADFARALHAGGELAYIIALPRRPIASCFDLAALASSAPWLAGGSIDDALVPLVDTRDEAVMKRDRVSASIEWDGTLRMSDRP